MSKKDLEESNKKGAVTAKAKGDESSTGNAEENKLSDDETELGIIGWAVIFAIIFGIWQCCFSGTSHDNSDVSDNSDLSDKSHLFAKSANVFEEDGVEWHTIDSEAGQECFVEINKQAKWGVSVNTGEHFLMNFTKYIEKEGNCKMKDYTFYTGPDSVLVNNAFNASRKMSFLCIKNNKTGKYTVYFSDNGREIDEWASGCHGNECERYDATGLVVENGVI